MGKAKLLGFVDGGQPPICGYGLQGGTVHWLAFCVQSQQSAGFLPSPRSARPPAELLLLLAILRVAIFPGFRFFREYIPTISEFSEATFVVLPSSFCRSSIWLLFLVS